MASANGKRRGLLAALAVSSLFSTSSFAAGSVAMQVEHLVKQAMAEYNTAMEDSDSAAFGKYFASNAKYESPLFKYSTRADLARHLDSEFKTYKARYQVNKMFIQETSAAIVLTWEAVDRKSGDEILDLLAALNEKHGKTIVMVTHDPRAAERAQMIRHLEKGLLEIPT